VFEVTPVAPAVMWVDRAEIVEGGSAEATSSLRRHPPGTRAVLERKTVSAQLAEAATRGALETPAVAGRLIELERNRLVAEIEAPDEGIVVLHESYAPGWRAWVDGQEHEIVPANGMFRGIRVAAGRHRIVMQYEVPGWVLLALVSLLGLLGAALLALVGWRQERRGR
jgi:hypothetical protein